jgi:hypothetical protein
VETAIPIADLVADRDRMAIVPVALKDRTGVMGAIQVLPFSAALHLMTARDGSVPMSRR